MARKHRNAKPRGVAPPPVAKATRAADPAPQPLTIDRALVAAATETGDEETALRLAFAHVDARFKAAHGDVAALMERQLAFRNGRAEVTLKALDKNDRILAGEPVQIHAVQEHGGVDGPADPYVELPPRKWQLKDQVNAGFAVVMIIGLMIASYLGFYASFMNAELEVFHQHPYVPLALAVLAPAAGYAIKAAGAAFADPLVQDRYRQGVIIAGIAAFFLYVPIFALQFKGLSGAWDPFAEPNALLAWAFNVTHVFAETLIAGGIFAALERTAAGYSRTRKIDNPNRPALSREDERLTALAEIRVAEAGTLEGRLARLYGVRDDALALVETAIRERMNRQPPEGLL